MDQERLEALGAKACLSIASAELVDPADNDSHSRGPLAHELNHSFTPFDHSLTKNHIEYETLVDKQRSESLRTMRFC